jgi:N-acetylmuramoyl-L-alanine amidase CwlA
VTGKKCPAPYVNEPAWSSFKKLITSSSVKELVSINDIVWELGNRGIVSDKKGMIEEMSLNPNGRLYWLARKSVQYMRERD